MTALVDAINRLAAAIELANAQRLTIQAPSTAPVPWPQPSGWPITVNGWICPTCGGWVPNNTVHFCSSAR